MILVRVEPENIGPLGMNATQRKESWLSGFQQESQRLRMSRMFDERAMDQIVGCWFSPALRRTEGKLDVLIYANEIIGADNRDSAIRILAIDIDDDEAEQYKLANVKIPYARQRSQIHDGEYLLPKDIPERAVQVLLLAPGEMLEEQRFLNAVEAFRAHHPHFENAADHQNDHDSI